MSSEQGASGGSTPRPAVTLGLPVYNGSDYLRETLKSVRSQTFEDYELIISDNDSSDETAQIVAEFSTTDPRIRYIKHPQNIGAHNNYNSIIPLARGEFFKWIAHDDPIEPTFLEACVAVLERQTEVVLAFTAADLIDGTGKKVGELVSTVDYEQDSPYERLRAYIGDRVKSPQIFGVIRLSTLLETPLLGNFRGADFSLLMELSMRGRFVVIDDHLFLYRFHDARYSAQAPESVRQWYEPGRESPTLATAKQLQRLLGAIRRVPMPVTQRVRCSIFAGYWAIRHFRQFGSEVMDWVRYQVGRIARRGRRS